MENSNKENKTDTIARIKKELVEGNFDKALIMQREKGILASEITSISHTVFSELITSKEFNIAIELAQLYNLSKDKIDDAVIKGFGSLLGKGEYEKAAQWGMEYKLSSSEILRATVKMFESCLVKSDLMGALAVAEKYTIPNDAVINSASGAFNAAFQRGDFLSAAMFGKEFDLSEKRVLTAAVNAFQEAILKGNWNSLIKIGHEFNILSDDTYDDIPERERDKAINIFFEHAIKNNIQRGKANLVQQILEATELLNSKYERVPLKELVNNVQFEIARLHNSLLTKGMENEAFEIIEHFGLLEADALAEVKISIIETAESYHHILLKHNKYDEAKNIKDKYKLFGKNILSGSFAGAIDAACEFLENTLANGDFKKGPEIIKEYNIPKDRVVEITNKMIIERFEKSQFEDVFHIMKNIKINPNREELKEIAQKKFSDAISNNKNELAAEIGKIFNLDEKSTKKAAYQAWVRQIRNGRYDKAAQLRKEHRIPAKMTRKVAHEIYKYNLEISRPDIAKRIRNEYAVKFNIIDIIKEFLGRIFKRNKN